MTSIAPSFLIGTSSFLHDTRTCIKALMSSNFSRIQPALKRVNDHCIMLPSFLIGSSSFLQVTRTTMKSRMSLTMDCGVSCP